MPAVYLHRQQLDELIATTDHTVDDPFEPLGVCHDAVMQLALEAGVEVQVSVEQGDLLRHAAAAAFVSGVLLGLRAAERIGR